MRNQTNGIATVRFGAGHAIELQDVANDIQAVCPLAPNKVVSFGWNAVGYDVNIIDPQRGAVTDSFVAYDPMMSPNQRWIASRHFYALHSEIQISEEYLLYDLNASASENRHDLTPYTTGDLGWAMYPAFPGNAPIDLADIPDANRHEWRSKSFFWAQDSQAVFFADSVGTRVSLVMVLVSSGRPQAYTYPVSCRPVRRKPRPRDSPDADGRIE